MLENKIKKLNRNCKISKLDVKKKKADSRLFDNIGGGFKIQIN